METVLYTMLIVCALLVFGGQLANENRTPEVSVELPLPPSNAELAVLQEHEQWRLGKNMEETDQPCFAKIACAGTWGPVLGSLKACCLPWAKNAGQLYLLCIVLLWVKRRLTQRKGRAPVARRRPCKTQRVAGQRRKRKREVRGYNLS